MLSIASKLRSKEVGPIFAANLSRYDTEDLKKKGPQRDNKS